MNFEILLLISLVPFLLLTLRLIVGAILNYLTKNNYRASLEYITECMVNDTSFKYRFISKVREYQKFDEKVAKRVLLYEGINRFCEEAKRKDDLRTKFSLVTTFSLKIDITNYLLCCWEEDSFKINKINMGPKHIELFKKMVDDVRFETTSGK